jgi:hypothetical protein
MTDCATNVTDAQLLAFEDTWHWGPSAEATALRCDTPEAGDDPARVD